MTTTSSAAGTMMTISDRCHSAVPRMESRIMVPHTVPARGGLVPHTDRLHMGQGARSTAARLRRAHHPRMVPHHQPFRHPRRGENEGQDGLERRSGKSGGKSGKVTTRRVKPKNKPVDLTKSSSASPAGSHNDLNIADVHVGDKLTHDHFGLGTVIETQDKGMNSVITVDFGNGEVKRLLLRMAPIEML